MTDYPLPWKACNHAICKGKCGTIRAANEEFVCIVPGQIIRDLVLEAVNAREAAVELARAALDGMQPDYLKQLARKVVDHE